MQQPLGAVGSMMLLVLDVAELGHRRHELEVERAGQVVLVLEGCRLVCRSLVGHGHQALEIGIHHEGNALLVAEVAKYQRLRVVWLLQDLLHPLCRAAIFRMHFETELISEVSQSFPAEEPLHIMGRYFAQKAAQVINPGVVGAPVEQIDLDWEVLVDVQGVASKSLIILEADDGAGHLQLFLDLGDIFDVDWEFDLIQPTPVELVVVVSWMVWIVVPVNRGNCREHRVAKAPGVSVLHFDDAVLLCDECGALRKCAARQQGIVFCDVEIEM